MATSIAVTQRPSLSLTFANKYGIDQSKVFIILKETALKSKEPITDAEVAAFMVVCNQYDLNPFIKEIFGFISKGKMQYVISVDGWSTLINRQKELNGIEFHENFNDKSINSITCKIHRTDRALPTVITEYFSECKGNTDTWQRWPIRMLRHKALIQCARLAFGLAGIMDDDEAERLPGYVSPTPILEGSSRDSQVEAQMEALGWNSSRKNLARQQFDGNPVGLRDYVAKEYARMLPVQQAQPSRVIDAEPAFESSEDVADYPDQPASDEGITFERAAEPDPATTPKRTAGRKADW